MPCTSAHQGLSFYARSNSARFSIRYQDCCTPSLSLPLCRKNGGKGQWCRAGLELLPQQEPHEYFIFLPSPQAWRVWTTTLSWWQ